MNLDWYYTFLILAKHLNYHKASEELFLTEPTLHQQIKKLEKHLQVKLFETIGRNLSLTRAGKEFIPITKKLIKTYEESIEKIQLKDKQFEDHLSIATSPYIATYLLPKFLPYFFDKYPSIKISISVLQGKIANAIENNQFDVGIDREEPFTKKITSKAICEGKIALFYPQVAENLSEIQMYQNYKILSDNHPNYWNNVKAEISTLVPESHFISIKDISVTEKLIEMGQGISYLPLYLKTAFDKKINYRISTNITTPVSFTYIMNRKTSNSIECFKYEFEEFIATEQNKI
ncbi:LysR family transcriptional regulator [Streptococcus marmotae]|uniref:LysR family transcriptional regulator n=1 Tax=Streptococcus marmotae TaxID=1825069 RepID=UPI000834570D|nr:LysR family transcriptional regulator [Streptococcus marmotae]